MFTKWVDKEKVERSLAYLNGTARPCPLHAALGIVGAWVAAATSTADPLQ